MYTNSHDTALMRQGSTVGYATPGSAAEHKRTLVRRLRTRLILCLIATAVAIPALILSAPDHLIIFMVAAAVVALATLAAYSAVIQYDRPPVQGNVRVSTQLAHDLTPQMRDKLFLARQDEDPRVLEEVIRYFEDQNEAERKKAVAGSVQKILKKGRPA